MKLGSLKTAIRQMRDVPEMKVSIGNQDVWMKVQKASLLQVLDTLGHSRNSETGIEINGCRITFGVEEPSLDELLD